MPIRPRPLSFPLPPSPLRFPQWLPRLKPRPFGAAPGSAHWRRSPAPLCWRRSGSIKIACCCFRPTCVGAGSGFLSCKCGGHGVGWLPGGPAPTALSHGGGCQRALGRQRLGGGGHFHRKLCEWQCWGRVLRPPPPPLFGVLSVLFLLALHGGISGGRERLPVSCLRPPQSVWLPWRPSPIYASLPPSPTPISPKLSKPSELSCTLRIGSNFPARQQGK